MNEKVFWDTWAFEALFNSKDQWHHHAVKIFKQYDLSRSAKVTTNFVLDETLTSLSILVGPSDACEIVEDYILPSFDIIEVSKPVFRKALNLRRKYPEKADISFTDFTSLGGHVGRKNQIYVYG